MKHSRSLRIGKSDDRNAIRVLNSGKQQTGQANVQIPFDPGFTDHRRQTREYFNPFGGIVVANSLQLLTIDCKLAESVG